MLLLSLLAVGVGCHRWCSRGAAGALMLQVPHGAPVFRLLLFFSLDPSQTCCSQKAQKLARALPLPRRRPPPPGGAAGAAAGHFGQEPVRGGVQDREGELGEQKKRSVDKRRHGAGRKAHITNCLFTLRVFLDLVYVPPLSFFFVLSLLLCLFCRC